MTTATTPLFKIEVGRMARREFIMIVFGLASTVLYGPLFIDYDYFDSYPVVSTLGIALIVFALVLNYKKLHHELSFSKCLLARLPAVFVALSFVVLFWFENGVVIAPFILLGAYVWHKKKKIPTLIISSFILTTLAFLLSYEFFIEKIY